MTLGEHMLPTSNHLDQGCHAGSSGRTGRSIFSEVMMLAAMFVPAVFPPPCCTTCSPALHKDTVAGNNSLRLARHTESFSTCRTSVAIARPIKLTQKCMCANPLQTF